jgi:hypothetical protein
VVSLKPAFPLDELEDPNPAIQIQHVLNGRCLPAVKISVITSPIATPPQNASSPNVQRSVILPGPSIQRHVEMRDTRLGGRDDFMGGMDGLFERKHTDVRKAGCVGEAGYVKR